MGPGVPVAEGGFRIGPDVGEPKLLEELGVVECAQEVNEALHRRSQARVGAEQILVKLASREARRVVERGRDRGGGSSMVHEPPLSVESTRSRSNGIRGGSIHPGFLSSQEALGYLRESLDGVALERFSRRAS